MGIDAASIWDNWNESGGPKYPHAKIVQFVFRNFPAHQRADTKVLDVGCGSGVHLWFLGREGFQIHGTDISEKGVANAKAWLDKEGIGIEDLQVTAIENAGYSENYFDLIVCCGVLECVNQDTAFTIVSTAHKLLKVGGKAIFVFAAANDFRLQGDNTLNLHGYTNEEVAALFHAFDWSVCHIDNYITTFKNQESLSNDFLITVQK